MEITKVYILGKGAGWDDAPMIHGESDRQVWGLNDHIMSRPFDIIFEPHDVEWWKEHCDEATWYHKTAVSSALQESERDGDSLLDAEALRFYSHQQAVSCGGNMRVIRHRLFHRGHRLHDGVCDLDESGEH